MQVPHRAGGVGGKAGAAPGPEPAPLAMDVELEVRQGKEGSFVEGLTAWPITSADEALSIIQQGRNNRKIASLNFNERNNKSHLVVQVSCAWSDASTGQRSFGKV